MIGLPPIPIIVFGYRRPAYLLKTLNSLAACRGVSDHPIIIFLDGPRGDVDRQACAETVEVATLWAEGRAEIRVSNINSGLAKSIIRGVTDVLERHDAAIILEDDMALHPLALEWLTKGLTTFADNPHIMAVTAYQYAVPQFSIYGYGLLLPFVSSWAWGTWRRAWAKFDPAALGALDLKSDADLRRKFDLDGSFPMSSYLLRSLSGEHDSWAARWSWTVFREGGVTLFPPSTLVRNFGDDETATHRSRNPLRRIFPRPTEAWWGDDAVPPGLPEPLQVPNDDLESFKAALRKTGAMTDSRLRSLANLISTSRAQS